MGLNCISDEEESSKECFSIDELPNQGVPETRKFTFEKSNDYQTNKVSHQKYTLINCIPKFLFEQFKFFFNFFYLAITLTQFIPIYRVGFLVTYVFPLLFVLAVSFVKEMFDEYNRWKRDREQNMQKYTLITPFGPAEIYSQDLHVGHIISVHAGERIPADLIVLKTSDEVGTTFIKTTQLDGETDWKLRRSLPFTQIKKNVFDIANIQFEIESPRPEIYDFSGRVTVGGEVYPIGVESTVWAEASVATGSIIGIVAYTGTDTKSALNGAPTAQKIGKIDAEINSYSTVLFALLFAASFVATALNGFSPNFHVLLVRFVLLFSFIIPISMRVNLDMAKMIYAHRISHDPAIRGAIMRNSTLPEEFGRVEYLFTDKTGTLTKNEMEFKKLQIDNITYSAASDQTTIDKNDLEVFMSLALCHSVTVTTDGFQSSSPDEIALVTQAARVGYELLKNDDEGIQIKMPDGTVELFRTVAVLPFSSVWRFMGLVVTNEKYGNMLLCKGADSSISKMCHPSEWLDEVVGNLAREGLRTLVYARKDLTYEEVVEFSKSYQEASTAVANRGQKILDVFSVYAKDMTLQGVTGVEDKLQDNVPETLEALEAANIKIWMLTGDKLETAICVALSSRLFSREVEYRVIKTFNEIVNLIEDKQQAVPPLVIDGTVLQQALDAFPDVFVSVARKSPAIVVCRCSPSQKECVVRSVKGVISCAVGDGGNDVSMIQAASVGVGIVGKEGKQASLSADCSINTFSHLQRLLLWHGTNSYKHSARLAQFVMHRGVIMTTTQAIYSLLFNIVPSSLYNDWLLMGFATFYTSLPVFSLIFDVFVDEETVLAFPELYQKCQKGRYLNGKTFIGWTWLAIYQGCAVMFLTASVFGITGRDERHLQSISFTAMLLTELALIGMDINNWNIISFGSEVLSVVSYIASMFILTDAFDISFILSWEFMFKIILITAVCIIPLTIMEYLKHRFAPTHEEQLKGSVSTESMHFFIL